MWRYIARRVVLAGVTAVGLILLIFLLMQSVPGDVVSQMVDTQSARDPQRTAELRAFFGLDQPWYAQLGQWFADVARGDLGESWRSGLEVTALIGPRIAVTLQLASMATLFSILIGVPVGIVAALYHGRWPDSLARVLSLTGLSVPVFWTGTMAILVLSITVAWSPPLQWTSPFLDPIANLSIMALPSLVLGTVGSAVIVRMTRNAMLEVMRENYVRTARSKGAPERVIMIRHALRNALVPIVTVAGLQLGVLLGGAVVVEEVFSLPGLGRLLLESIQQRDMPVIQGTILVIGLLFMAVNLLVDVLYAYLDPRIEVS